MAAKKKLWLVRRGDYLSQFLCLVESVEEPLLNADGSMPDHVIDCWLHTMCTKAVRRLTGLSLQKGQVVPVVSIDFRLAGKPRKAQKTA